MELYIQSRICSHGVCGGTHHYLNSVIIMPMTLGHFAVLKTHGSHLDFRGLLMSYLTGISTVQTGTISTTFVSYSEGLWLEYQT